MNDILGLIFAFTAYGGLRELVQPRTAASLPFGGRYRAIDFMLSNIVNAGSGDVGVIMRDSYQSLMDHLGSGRDWDLSRKNGGLILLPPFSYGSPDLRIRQNGINGKLEAMAGVESYITRRAARWAVLADGDCVTNIRLRDVVEAHEQSGADITVVCARKSVGDPGNSIYFRMDEAGRVMGIDAHPAQSRENESLGIFILEKKLLERLIEYGKTNDLAHFERGVLRELLPTLDVRPYYHEGYAARFHSVAAYHRHSMALLDPAVRAEVFDPKNPVQTRIRDDGPTYYADTAAVQNSLVANGCRIEGRVENSILFRGVRVAPGAVVKNSILMQDCRVMDNALASFVVADKFVGIRPGASLMGSPAYPVVVAKNTTV